MKHTEPAFPGFRACAVASISHCYRRRSNRLRPEAFNAGRVTMNHHQSGVGDEMAGPDIGIEIVTNLG